MPNLSALLAAATSVRVVAGGHFDYEHRKSNAELLRLGDEDLAELGTLKESLATGPTVDQIALMQEGQFTFAFYREGRPFLPVTYVHRGFVRWPGSQFDAPLLRPDD